jgi:hypothetical protein
VSVDHQTDEQNLVRRAVNLFKFLGQAVLFGHHLYMVALLTPLRWAIRSTDALRRSSSRISSIAAARTASRRSSLRGRPRARLGVIPPVSTPSLVQR